MNCIALYGMCMGILTLQRVLRWAGLNLQVKLVRHMIDLAGVNL